MELCDMKVAVGMHDSTSISDNLYISVREWFTHPDWEKGPDPLDLDKDFAIIKLAQHVSLKDPKDPAPACLPKTSKNYDDVSATVREAVIREKK